ncbi:hypothetical protein HA466_0271680 [Hirschfeldia incana]|nr:hypothetical protein HA466_0271680 [Hirschfeldia incana]
MSKWGLDRGPSPLELGAGRVRAGEFLTRKIAGLAGVGLCGTGLEAGQPTVNRGFLFVPHPDASPEKENSERLWSTDDDRVKKPSSDDGRSMSDTRQCFWCRDRVRDAVEELNPEGSNKSDSSSSMCLLLFPPVLMQASRNGNDLWLSIIGTGRGARHHSTSFYQDIKRQLKEKKEWAQKKEKALAQIVQEEKEFEEKWREEQKAKEHA